MGCREGQLLALIMSLCQSLPNCSARLPQATSNQMPTIKKALGCVLPATSPQPGPPTQHLPVGPGHPVLLLTPPVPLALWPVPLWGLLRGARPCWVPALPDLSSLGSRGPAPLCGSEQVWTNGSAWGLFHPRACSQPSGQVTGLSWAPGLGLRTHTLFPGPGLPVPPRERSRGTKPVFCGEPGTELADDAPESPFGPFGDAGARLVAGALGGLSCSILLCVCACSFSFRVLLVVL